MSRRVLITSCGSTTAMSVAKSLRLWDDSIETIGTDIFPVHELPSSRYIDSIHRVPTYDMPNYVTTLLTLAKKHGVSDIIPILDQEVEVLANHVEDFDDASIRLHCPSYEAVQLCNDKFRTNAYLGKHGIDVPDTYLVEKDYPTMSAYFIKPRYGVSSQQCFVAQSRKQIHALVPMISNPIIQPVLEGEFFVADIVSDASFTIIAHTVRQEYQSKAGVGVKAVTVLREPYLPYLQSIVKALKIQGICNIEFFSNSSTVHFVEINPRPSAGCILSAMAGVNIIQAALTGQTNNGTYKPNITMSRFWQETYYDGTQSISNPYDTQQ